MIKNWGATFALLCLFALPIIDFEYGALLSSPERTHPAKNDQSQQQTDQPSGKTNEQTPILDFIAHDGITFFTFILAISTIFLSIASAIQIRFLIRADETTRIAANAAKSANEINVINVIADQRAWVILDDFEVITAPTIVEAMTYEKEKYVEFFVRAKWRNIGKVPAVACKTKMAFTFEYDKIQEFLSSMSCAEFKNHNYLSARYMAPNKGYHKDWGFPMEIPIQNVWRSGIPTIYGVITYISTIDMSKHQTAFVIHLSKRNNADPNKYGGSLDFTNCDTLLTDIVWEESTGSFAT